MKTCTICKVIKSPEAFNRDRATRSGLSHRCKPCESAKALVWNRANRDKKNANNKRYAERHPEKPRKLARDWRAKKGVQWMRAYDRARYPQRKHLALAYSKRYKADKLRAVPKWANHFFISEAYHLAALRTKMLGYPWHVDHIVPLRSKLVCGLHVEHNLQVIPGVDNLRKQNHYWPDMPEPLHA